MLNIQRDDDGTYPAYAWPGGYPLIYLMDDGEVLCPHCANDTSNPIHEGGGADGWRIDAQEIHWEGGPLFCAHCNRTIESAYGEVEE